MLVATAIKLNVIVSVENPTRSFLWSTKFFEKIIAGLLHEATFQQCMWGSRRATNGPLGMCHICALMKWPSYATVNTNMKIGQS